MSLYFQEDEQMHYVFHRLFVYSNLSVEFITGAHFVQKILESRRSKKYALIKAMLSPSLFESHLYFHELMFLEECTRKKLVSTLCNYSTGMCMAYAVSLVMMVWHAATRAPGLRSIQNGLQNVGFRMFEVNGTRE